MEVSNIEEYIKEIKQYHSMEGCIGLRRLFYRGQSSNKYKILPLVKGIITIPSKAKEALLIELEMLGISYEKLFPDDIDGCCKELVRDITKNAFSA